ncbi:MAG: hypothetical protein ABIW38_13940 [Ferruginibacter sp.]
MNIFTCRKIFISYFLFALIFTGFSCSSSRRTLAVEEGWDLLGELKVDFGRDRDILEILRSTRYTNIKFKVEGKEIRLNELKVVYRNGDKLEPTIDETIAADQFSRIIELGPEGKEILRIEFRYRTVGSLLTGRAKVIVFGKRYNPGY